MFTGIITDIGTIRTHEQRGDLRLVIESGYDMETVAIGASIACSGACLTVVEKGPGWFAVDLSAETVARTAPGLWAQGGKLNLERALKVGDELGGHIVTGHVDGIGHLVSASREGDSIRLVISAPAELAAALAAKGSITLDGISLTVNSVEDQPAFRPQHHPAHRDRHHAGQPARRPGVQSGDRCAGSLSRPDAEPPQQMM